MIPQTGHLRINSRTIGTSTSISPGNNTNLLVVEDKGAAGVPLASVLLPFGITKAEHLRRNFIIVRLVAGLVADSWNFNGLQEGRREAGFVGLSPTGNGGQSSNGHILVLGLKSDGLSCRAQFDFCS